MKLSLLICLYNTEKELFERSLKSILSGTLALKDDFEICVYDDGSSLDYGDIISRYPIKYEKGENRGILSARLSALNMAEGEYVAFVDSDDTVSFNYHRPMLEYAEKTGADIVINDWAFDAPRGRYFCKRDTTLNSDIDLFSDDILYAFLSQGGREHSYFVLWNKIIKRELFVSFKDKLYSAAERTGGYNYSEDALITFYAFSRAKRVVNIHTGYYFYYIHPRQTVNIRDREKLLCCIDCMSSTLATVREEIRSLGREELLEFVDNWAALMSRTHYTYAKTLGYTDIYPIIKEKYGVDKLEKSKIRDGSVYTGVKLLADNFTEIDAALFEIYKGGRERKIKPPRDSYAKRMLSVMKDGGAEITLSADGEVLPEARIKFINKLIMNEFVYSLGALIFPKGSKIRAKLKGGR